MNIMAKNYCSVHFTMNSKPSRLTTLLFTALIGNFLASSLLVFVLSEQIFHAHIDEEQPVGSVVLSLLPEGRPSPAGKLILLPSSSEDERYFIFKPPDSTNLTVAKRIDFEHFRKRPSAKAGVITLQVHVGLADGSNFGLVEVDVADINDNAPQFSKSQFEISFQEGVDKAGSRRQILLPIDADSSENGEIDSYSIVSGNDRGLFRLIYDSFEAKLFLELAAAELDREEQAIHRLQIAARDKGHPALTGYAIIVVSVLDANDNAPRCQDQTFNVTAAAASRTLQATKLQQRLIAVSDADEGANGQIARYQLVPVPGTLAPRWPVATIDEKSGQLTLPQSGGLACRDLCPNSLSSSHYSCCFYQITVTDNGDIPLSSTCRFTLIVEYLNNHAPVISLRPATGQVTIQRKQSNGDQLLLIVVTDSDAGPGSLVTAELLPGDSKMAHFQLFEKSARPGFAIYSLKLIRDFDWNSNDLNSFNLTIRASDAAIPPKVTYSLVKFSFEGVDSTKATPTLNVQPRSGDLVPMPAPSSHLRLMTRFSPSTYHVSVAENLPLGTPIFRPNFVIKSDSNISLNDCKLSIVYPSSMPSWQQLFEIHEASGYLISRQPVDREQFLPAATLAFNITASCSQALMQIPKQSAQVFVNLGDENDNAPQFNSTHFAIKLPIDSKSTNQAYSFGIVAFDPDQGINATLSYSLQNVTAALPVSISIKPSTGLVTITGLTGSVMQQQATFSVCAKDGGDRQSCVPVSVHFMEHNQNISFTSSPLRFSQNVYAFALPKFDTGFVGCVKALSANFQQSASYKISGGSHNNGAGFFIHSRSGCLFLVNAEVARKVRQPQAARISLDVEAYFVGTLDDHRASIQVLIFQSEAVALNVSIPPSSLPANLQKFAGENLIAAAKFTPASSLSNAGLTVNPHGQISTISSGVASARQRRSTPLIIFASNETTFQRIIIQIRQQDAPLTILNRMATKEESEVLRIDIDRSTPLFSCLHRLDPGSRCKLTQQQTGDVELVTVDAKNCLSLAKLKPLKSATSLTTASRFELVCKNDVAMKTQRQNVYVTFRESQHLLDFINQKSIITLTNQNKEEEDGNSTLKPVHQLPFPVLPVRGNSWAISSSGSVYLLPSTKNNRVSLAELWLSGEPELGLISRPLGLIIPTPEVAMLNGKQQNRCIFRVPASLRPGQSIGHLRNHLPWHQGRYQLLRHEAGARFLALDWTAPFGDDLLLLSWPLDRKTTNYTLRFARLTDQSIVDCSLIFEEDEEDELAKHDAKRNVVVVFDSNLPQRSPIFDLANMSYRRKLQVLPPVSSSPKGQMTPITSFHYEIDQHSKLLRLSMGAAAPALPTRNNRMQVYGNASVYSLPANFSIDLIADEDLLASSNEEDSSYEAALAYDRYQQHQPQQISLTVLFRPNNSPKARPDFQLVVDEMRYDVVEAPGAATAAAAPNNGITTTCSLNVNDVESPSGGAVAVSRLIFRPSFLRRPSFGESVVFTLNQPSRLVGPPSTIFRINNATGEVAMVGFPEKETEKFEVVAKRLEDGITSSLTCVAKFASFTSNSRAGQGSYYVPVYRFSVDEVKEDSSSHIALTISPRRQVPATATLEYRLSAINPSKLDCLIDHRTGVINCKLDHKLIIGRSEGVYQFSLVVDIAKRNLLTGQMVPVEMGREVTALVRFMPQRLQVVRQLPVPTPSPTLFPRSRLLSVPPTASIPYVLPVDFSYFSQQAAANSAFRSLLRSPDGCLRIDWANNRILLVKYFHNPPVTTCQLETDSDIFKLTFMRKDSWASSDRLLNKSSIPNSEIVVSELLPASTIVARILPIAQELTSVYLVDVEPQSAIGRFYVTETGELLLHDQLDYDAGDRQFTIRIAAVQMSPNFVVEFANLTLRVKNEDDIAPQCHQPRQFIRITIPEQTGDVSREQIYQFDNEKINTKRPKRVKLTSLLDFASDSDTLPDQLAFRLVEEIAGNSGDQLDNLVFSVDSQGDLYGIFSNNYRPSQWSYDINFKIESPSGLSATCPLTLLVENTLDYSAITPCSSDDLFFRVSENTEPGQIVAKVACGLPSMLLLLPNSSSAFPFKLLSSGHLVLTERLDFENQPVYFAETSLFDQPTVQMTVQVLDCNDQDPIVEASSSQTFSVVENSPRGTRLGQVKASDGDNGISSPLSYSLAAITPPTDCFAIDPESGFIFTICEELDRESLGEDFFATVVVRDRDLETGECGWTSRSSVLNIRLKIEDMNDNPPRALVPDQFFVVEDRGVGFQIGWFKVEDADRVGSAKLETLLIAHNDTFSLVVDNEDPTVRWLILRKAIDFEQQKQYVVPLRVTDEDGLNSHSILIVNVLDANEHDPHFSQKSYSFGQHLLAKQQATEDNKPIGQLWASDGDGSTYEKLEFSLVESEKSPFFHLDKWSGELFVNRRLSDAFNLVFDDGQTINITARVFDRAGHVDNATIVIKQEAEMATLSTNFTAIYVKMAETNLTAGRPTVVLNAYDYLPQMSGKMLTLSVVDSSFDQELEGLFAVDSKTGEVSLERSLDFEALKPQNRLFNLRISFTDDSGVHFQPHLDIRVIVLDVNDNAPSIQGAPVSLLIVSDDAAPGQVVWSINATDADSAANSQLSFSVAADSDLGDEFELDPDNGSLKLVRLLDRGRKSDYILNILVSDNGQPIALTSTMTLKIQVVAGVKPASSGLEMTFGVFEFHLPMNPPVDSIVGAVSALASDLGAAPRFSLLDGDARLFTIGPSSGIIRTRQMLFVYGRKRFQFTANVGVAGRPTASSASVTVYLSDAVPADPGLMFDRPERVVELRELIPIGSVVANMSQSLRSLSRDIMFSIVGGNFDFSFNIDPNNGVIRVARRLDYESTNVYHLLIKAEMVASVNAYAYATVDVIVTDEEDSLPVFVNPSTNPTFLRFTRSQLGQSGAFILGAYARDPESAKSRMFRYLINNDNADLPLGIDKDTGVVKLTAPLAEEVKRKEFVFTIQAVSQQDRSVGGSASKKSAPLQVHLLIGEDSTAKSSALNLHAPVFTRQHSGVVKSSAPIGWPVMKVSASDPDDESALLQYSIEDQTFPFSIDNQTGIMSVSRMITLTGDVYVPVLVSDGRHRTRTNVHIEILTDEKVVDSVAEGVEFDRDTYTVDVDDNWPPAKPFMRVYALSNTGSAISYSIQHPSVDHLIGINATTGELALKSNRRLPFGGGALSFKVQAVDDFTKSRDEATIVIRLRRPFSERYRLRTAPNLANSTVLENATLGTVIGILKIEPAILEPMTFIMLESEPSGYFELQNDSIVLIKKLDYEDAAIRQFRLKLGALPASRDYTSLPLVHSVSVAVLDVNDCPPIFEQPIIHANLNRTTTSFVTRLAASDADISPQFREIRFKLAQPYQQTGVSVDEESGTFRLIARNFVRANVSLLLFDVVAYNVDDPELNSVMTIVVTTANDDAKFEAMDAPWGDKVLLEVNLPSDAHSPVVMPFEDIKAGAFFGIFNESSQHSFSIDHKTGQLVPITDKIIVESNESETADLYQDLQLVYFSVTKSARAKRPKIVKVRVRRDPERWPLAKCERDVYSVNISDLVWTFGSANIFEITQIKAIFPRRRFSIAYELVTPNDLLYSSMFHVDPRSGVLKAKVTEGADLPDRFNFTVIPHIAQMWALPTLNCTVQITVAKHSLLFHDILSRLQRIVAFEELEQLEYDVEQYRVGLKLSFDCLAESTVCRVTLIHMPTGISREASITLLPSAGNISPRKTRRFALQKTACSAGNQLGLSFPPEPFEYLATASPTAASFIDYKLDVETPMGKSLEVALQFTLPGSDREHEVLTAFVENELVNTKLQISASRRTITAQLNDQVLAVNLENLFEKTALHVADLIVTVSPQNFWSLELANCRSALSEPCWYWSPFTKANRGNLKIARVIVGSSNLMETDDRFVGCVERVLINGAIDLFSLEATSKSGSVAWSRECACKNRSSVILTHRKVPSHQQPNVRIAQPGTGKTGSEGLSEMDWMPLALGTAFSVIVLVGLLIALFALRHRITPLWLRVKLRKRDEFRRRSATSSCSPSQSSGEFALHHGGPTSRTLISGSASTFAMSGMQVVIGTSNGVVVMSGPSPPNSCGDSGFIDPSSGQPRNSPATQAFVTSPTSDESSSHSPNGTATTDSEHQQLTASQLPRPSSQQDFHPSGTWALKRATLGTRSANYQQRRQKPPKTAKDIPMVPMSPPAIVRPTGYEVSTPQKGNQPWQSVVGSEWEYHPGTPASPSKKKSQTSVRKNSTSRPLEALYATSNITASTSFNRALSQRTGHQVPSGTTSQTSGRSSSRQNMVAASKNAAVDRNRRTAPIPPEDQNLWQALLAASEPPTQTGRESLSTRRPKTQMMSSSKSQQRLPKSAASPTRRVAATPQHAQSSFGFGNHSGVYL